MVFALNEVMGRNRDNTENREFHSGTLYALKFSKNGSEPMPKTCTSAKTKCCAAEHP